VASSGSIHTHAVRVPGILVDAIVLVPDQKQTMNTEYDPAISGELRKPLSTLPPVAFSLEKVMARRAALELHAARPSTSASVSPPWCPTCWWKKD
jgi:propionate CoA-transferase